MVKKIVFNSHLNFYILAAKKLGISFRIFDAKKLVLFKKGQKKWYIFKARTPLNLESSAFLSNDKYLTNQILRKNDILVPESKIFNKLDEALSYWEKNRHKVVLKPNDNIGGKGILVSPKNKEEFVWGFKNALKNTRLDKRVLVEDFIKGVDYRVLVLGEKVIAAAQRLPPFIIGNGKDSIRTLIRKENKKRKDTLLKNIKIDNDLKSYLLKYKLSIDSILKRGKKLFLRDNCNLSTGGITIDKTEDIHPDNINIAIKAVKTLGLKLAGVDIITQDISQSMLENGGIINEINSPPGLRIHYCVIEGKVRDVALDIQKYILENI
ncbi:ATP-grasp domain-containing protein [Candidatus Beckwithbacteria bacterium]|nr:ATP-grasp domain-containing protein [Candidatus Beckwithbacteria bacterium]